MSTPPPAKRRSKVFRLTLLLFLLGTVCFLAATPARLYLRHSCVQIANGPLGRSLHQKTGGPLSSSIPSAGRLANAGHVQQISKISAKGSTLQTLSQGHLPPTFNYKKVLAIVAFDRFEYFRTVIRSIQAAWGSEDYTLTVTIDGPPTNRTSFNQTGWQRIVSYSKQLQWLAEEGFGFKRLLLNVSDTNMGVWPNKKNAVAGAFKLSDFVIVLEDDIILERDALRWFEWHVTSGYIFQRPEVALVTCWSGSFPYYSEPVENFDLIAAKSLGMLDKFVLNYWATPWGWASWKRTWDVVGGEWTGQDLDLGNLIKQNGWFEAHPLVSRCNNIGSFGFHKAGMMSDHIQRRSVTSSSFSNLEHCSYTELPRLNKTAELHWFPYFQIVRYGINTSMPNVDISGYRTAIEKWKKRNTQLVIPSTC